MVVFEKNDRIGGLLRYGIPDFKMEKRLIDRRIEQMRAEGVEFRAVSVGARQRWQLRERRSVAAKELLRRVRCRGAGRRRRAAARPAGAGPRTDGVHFAMDFLPQQNRCVAGDKSRGPDLATGKHVVVIGGGDTGSDCVGTSNRHGAASVTQFELLPQPPEHENKPLIWPYWPIKLRTSQLARGRLRAATGRWRPSASRARTAR